MDMSHYFLTNQLSEEETRIITSIIARIEKSDRKVSIQQIANENFVSPASIIKMCKRLGFDGYSELFYHLSTKSASPDEPGRDTQLETLIDNYSEDAVKAFCDILSRFRERKLFVVGQGFSAIIANYLVQRFSICGFVAFNNVHFYDMMLFREQNELDFISNVEPSFVIAISQSGETTDVVKDVTHAKKKGYKIIAFTRKPDSTLGRLSDIVFEVDSTKQTLFSDVPNLFFGKVIFAFERLIARYITDNRPAKTE